LFYLSQDKIPSDLRTILTTVDPDLKPNIKVAKASGKDAHKLAAKTSLAKVIKHKGDDSPGTFIFLPSFLLFQHTNSAYKVILYTIELLFP
jgi:hypothetical protein